MDDPPLHSVTFSINPHQTNFTEVFFPKRTKTQKPNSKKFHTDCFRLNSDYMDITYKKIVTLSLMKKLTKS